MKKKTVSIIVPVYNAEAYLKKTVDSILAQTYTDIELVLINDGSKDSSLDICRSYEEADSRVHVYSFGNSGVASAREKGLRLSQGDYIAFVDSDDSLDKDYILNLVSAIEDNSADMACCNCIDYDGPNLSIEEDLTITDKGYFIDSFLANKRFCYCIWAKMYKRELVQDMQFPKLKYAEDTLFVTECFRKAEKVALIKYAGYMYSDNPDGAMRSSSGIQQALDNLVLEESIYNICKNDYPEKCSKADSRITNVLFNMICAGADLPENGRREAVWVIRSKIKEYKGRIQNSNRGKFVKMFYCFPSLTNWVIQTKHGLKTER